MIKYRRWSEQVVIMEEDSSALKFKSTTTRKRPLGRPRRRCEVNGRMHLIETGVNTRNWIYSAHKKGLLEILCEFIIASLGFILLEII